LARNAYAESKKNIAVMAGKDALTPAPQAKSLNKKFKKTGE
jgi:hypothetical protein